MEIAFKIQYWGGTQAEFTIAVINDANSSFSDYFVLKLMKKNSVVNASK